VALVGQSDTQVREEMTAVADARARQQLDQKDKEVRRPVFRSVCFVCAVGLYRIT
jgi:hypothetical protein